MRPQPQEKYISNMEVEKIVYPCGHDRNISFARDNVGIPDVQNVVSQHRKRCECMRCDQHDKGKKITSVSIKKN